MALPRSSLLLLGLLALGAAGGAGWMLLADGSPSPDGGGRKSGPVVPRDGGTGPPTAPPEAVPPEEGGGSPAEDEADDDMGDLDHTPHGPEGGATTQEILDAVAAGDWLEVERLLSAGGGSDDPAVTAALLRGLEDGRWRNAVAEMARYLKDPAALEKFLAVATGEGSELVRAAALRASAAIGGPGVLEAASALLASEKPGSSLGSAAATALGTLGTPEAARLLVNALRDRSNGPWASALVEALAMVRSPEALSSLGELVQDDAADPEFRASLIRALGQSRQPGVLNDLLRVSRDQGDEQVRTAAYQAMALVGSPEAVQELLQVVAGADNQGKFEAARALQSASSKAAGPLLEQALEGYVDPVLKPYLVTALGKTGSKSSLEVLGKIAADGTGDAGLRGTAVRAMGEIGHGDAAPMIVGVLETSTDPALRNQCMQALQKTATPEVLPRLERIFEGVREQTPDWFYLRSLIERLKREPAR